MQSRATVLFVLGTICSVGIVVVFSNFIKTLNNFDCSENVSIQPTPNSYLGSLVFATNSQIQFALLKYALVSFDPGPNRNEISIFNQLYQWIRGNCFNTIPKSVKTRSKFKNRQNEAATSSNSLLSVFSMSRNRLIDPTSRYLLELSSIRDIVSKSISLSSINTVFPNFVDEILSSKNLC